MITKFATKFLLLADSQDRLLLSLLRRVGLVYLILWCITFFGVERYYKIRLRRLERTLDELKIKSAEFKLILVAAGKESEIENPYEKLIADNEDSRKAVEKRMNVVLTGIAYVYCFPVCLYFVFWFIKVFFLPIPEYGPSGR